MFYRRQSLSVLLCYLLLATAPAIAQVGAADGQWRVYSGDQGATKYAPLEQINRDNVEDLRIAWRRPAVNPALLEANPDIAYSNNFRNTPVMVDGMLYGSNGIGLVEAFDPATGEVLWMQQPTEANGGLRGTAMRGVAYWENEDEDMDEDERRIVTVRGEYLYSLDADNGKPDPDFGEQGRVDLKAGLGPLMQRYSWTSAPIIVRDVVIVGSAMVPQDSASQKSGPPGDVRGYDVRTGALKWTFHVVPREGESGVETWENEAWRYTGAGNVWSLMSADEELGYVYLPTSSVTNDLYGGHRLGDNLFSDSIVCLDAETGERIWHYQTVHHDLWDFDNPAAPILADVTINGEPRKIVAQVTKQSFTYVLDRVTGEPIWPIEERPVAPSTVPGEKASPTQPFPTKPPPFDRQNITRDALIDFTPELRAEAEKILDQFVWGPLFTPPSVYGEEPGEKKGTLQLPGSVGGADWTGAAFDPQSGMLYVPSMTSPFVMDLMPGDPEVTDLRYRARSRELIDGPRGLPLFKPPYGRITALDLNTGELVWMVANGDGPRDHPEIAHLDLPPLGHPVRASVLATKTLLFTSEGDQINVRTPASGGGNKVRALDKATGEELWVMELAAGTTGAMMTYLHEGKQYVVMPIGGRGHSAEYIALSLP